MLVPIIVSHVRMVVRNIDLEWTLDPEHNEVIHKSGAIVRFVRSNGNVSPYEVYSEAWDLENNRWLGVIVKNPLNITDNNRLQALVNDAKIMFQRILSKTV